SELNIAQTMLMNEEPNYINSLRIKYYPFSLTSRAFSDAEKEWLAAYDQLRIGCLNHYLPYSDTDPSGNVYGIVRGIISMIMQRLNIDNVKASYIGYNNYNEMLAGMNLGEVDVVFPVGGSLYHAEESGIYQSNPVLSAPTELVFHEKFLNAVKEESETMSHFAVNENNTMQYYYIHTNFPNARISFYPSIEACLDAVQTGKADYTTINGMRSELLNNRKYRHLSSRQLNANDNRYFGVSIGNEALLKLINRGINVLGTDYIQTLAYRYSERLYTYSFIDFIKDNSIILCLLVMVFALLIIVMLFRDVRRSKEALNMVHQANRAKIVFLNNMSHDIRTPMNAIVGFTALAQAHVNDTDQIMDYLNKITVSSQHLLSLINDVMDMNRIENGNFTIRKAEVHLPTLMGNLQTIVQSNLAEKHQDLTINTNGIIHTHVITDQLRISQIFLNILSNAIKYTQDNGTISLNVTEKPTARIGTANYIFRIFDNGIGANTELRQEIYEVFTRKKSSSSGGIHTSGLGMAITKDIIEMMGGTIKVNSTENYGTEFIVTIPCEMCNLAELPTAAKTDTTPLFSGMRILLAEDVETNQIIATALLRDVGFFVDVVSDGVSAVEKIKTAPAGYYNALLMDAQMPNMNGYEAAKIIRDLSDKQKANIPIIAVLSNAFADEQTSTLPAGMDALLLKPYNISQITQVLQELLMPHR
ncbi:MAG: response regulator, partial [Spirochaetales bacterium]|nr:response regulator [Spirochaetales bacterium]